MDHATASLPERVFRHIADYVKAECSDCQPIGGFAEHDSESSKESFSLIIHHYGMGNPLIRSIESHLREILKRAATVKLSRYPGGSLLVVEGTPRAMDVALRANDPTYVSLPGKSTRTL